VVTLTARARILGLKAATAWDEMRRILETSIEMDRLARDAYTLMAVRCADSDLKYTFKLMARDEADHLSWWEEILRAWNDGLLSDIVSEPADLAERLDVLLAEMRAVAPQETPDLAAEDCLVIAAKLEFYMLDPCFGEFIDLMEPAAEPVVLAKE
jgi:hypothetical protein